MKLVREIVGYPMSRDYRLLWSLAQRQSVVCIVDYHGGAQRDLSEAPPPMRDIAHTIRNQDGNVSVSARGVGYAGSIGTSEADDGVGIDEPVRARVPWFAAAGIGLPALPSVG